MSGGHFDYKQYQIDDVADKMQDEVARAVYKLQLGEETYSEATIERMKEAAIVCRAAALYVNRLDWLLSGDDGEETFHERLEQELKELGKKYEIA